MIVECSDVIASARPPHRLDTEPDFLPFFFMDIPEGRVLWDGAPGPMRPELEGEPSVLWLDDGSVVVRRPFPSAVIPGRHDLTSMFAETDILAARIASAAPLLQIQTKAEVARLARRRCGIDKLIPEPFTRQRFGARAVGLAIAACLAVAIHLPLSDTDGDGVLTAREFQLSTGLDG